MGNMYIAEFDRMPEPGGTVAPMFNVPPVAEQKITTSGTSASSAALNANTRYVRIKVSDAGHLKFGTGSGEAVTATTSSAIHLESGAYEGFAVDAGSKIAFIEGAA